MRMLRSTFYSLLVAVLAVSLAACDTTGEQNISWEPGDSRSIEAPDGTRSPGPYQVVVPDTSSFFVQAFTAEQDYEWTLDGEPIPEENIRRQGEYVDLTFPEAGTYTLTVDDGEYTGEITIEAEETTAAEQIGRIGAYSTLAGALSTDLTETLDDEDGSFTVFAPTNDAFLAAFDADDSEELEEGELPTAGVLEQLLQYHVLTAPILTDEVTDGQTAATLEGADVTLSTDADGNVVINDRATVSQADVPLSNGVFQGIDQVLLPPNGIVSFADQASDGTTVTVDGVYLPEGGFVVIHDEDPADGDSPTDVIGASEYLEPGFHNSVEVELDEGEELEADQTVYAALHMDTDDNETFDYTTTAGIEDEPYTRDGSAVSAEAEITVETEDAS